MKYATITATMEITLALEDETADNFDRVEDIVEETLRSISDPWNHIVEYTWDVNS